MTEHFAKSINIKHPALSTYKKLFSSGLLFHIPLNEIFLLKQIIIIIIKFRDYVLLHGLV